MDDIDKAMEEYRRKEEEERLAFLRRCHEKVKDDDDTVYLGLSYILAHRFRIREAYHGSGFHNVVYILLNYYVDHVEEDFMTWLHKDDGPFVKTPDEIKKIFPEFKCITSKAREIVELANQMYGLDLKYDSNEYYGTYIYSFSFDFNSFTPIDMVEVVELKNEISVLQKHNIDTTALEEKLNNYGFTAEQLEMI